MQRKVSSNPPGSGKFGKKVLTNNYGQLVSRQHVHYVLGICGGDCAGKKQLINQMFSMQQNGDWFIKDSKQKQRVTIIQQDYFLVDNGNRYISNGINWDQFQKAIISLFAGNEFVIKQKNRTLKPSKLLVLEGSHIFMQNLPIYKHMDCKVFIDSDADVRLSRRIYKDTQDDKKDLNQSIDNYLSNIKPSYQKEIQPCKIMSDIIIPHFGGGYDDHRKKEKLDYASNIQNAKGLILARVKEQMTKQNQIQQ